MSLFFQVKKNVTTKKPKAARSKKSIKDWFTLPQFKNVIVPRANFKSAKEPYCVLCGKLLCISNTNDLKKHCNSMKHKENATAAVSFLKERAAFAGQTSNALAKKTALLAGRLRAFIAENDLPLQLSDKLVPLFKTLAPNDTEVKNIALAKQKTGNVIREGNISNILFHGFFLKTFCKSFYVC